MLVLGGSQWQPPPISTAPPYTHSVPARGSCCSLCCSLTDQALFWTLSDSCLFRGPQTCVISIAQPGWRFPLGPSPSPSFHLNKYLHGDAGVPLTSATPTQRCTCTFEPRGKARLISAQAKASQSRCGVGLMLVAYSKCVSLCVWGYS